MRTMKTMRAGAMLVAVGLGFWPGVVAGEGGASMVETLGGQALEHETKFKKRGFTVRGTGGGAPPPPAEIVTEKRRVLFSARGIRGVPKGVEAFDRESKTVLEKKVAPEKNEDSEYGELAVEAGEESYEISYAVDPKSQLSADSIKFVKGGIDLADAGSGRFLAELTAALKDPRLAKFKYVIEGHASADGAAETNQELSQARANAIYAHLLEQGVAGEMLLPVGFGESKARFPESAPEAALAQDRRVVLYKLED